MFEIFKSYLKKDCVLIISIFLALISCFINKPNVQYIDYKVLILLFNLMLIISAFNKLSFLDYIAVSMIKKANSLKSIYFILMSLTFFGSMLFTNDVALLSFVPLSIIIAKKASFNPMKLIVIQTIAANLGSCLTPIGNPQNLYIYSFYKLRAADFFLVTFPIVIIAFIMLTLFIFREKTQSLNFELESISIKNKYLLVGFGLFFIMVILSVFNLLPYKAVFLGLILFVLFIDRSLILKVDYSLLITFVSFFIFIGNISSIVLLEQFMKASLSTEFSTFWIGFFSSQIISNVPSALLLSNFTPYYKALLLGVNLGGLGTLIASLASVISYKLYINTYNSNNYIKKFSAYNLISIFILVPIALFLISFKI